MDFDQLTAAFWDLAPQTPGYLTDAIGVYQYLLFQAVSNGSPDLSDRFDELVTKLAELKFSRITEALHWLYQANFITYLPAPSIGSAHLSIYVPS